MGEFFDNTTGRVLSEGTAHIKVSPEGRETLKAKHNLTEEQLDKALAQLSERATDTVHDDMARLRKETTAQRIRRARRLRLRKSRGPKYARRTENAR